MFSYCFDNVAKTCSYGLKISRNTQIKYILHFKAYVPALGTFNRSCLSASGMIKQANVALLTHAVCMKVVFFASVTQRL